MNYLVTTGLFLWHNIYMIIGATIALLLLRTLIRLCKASINEIKAFLKSVWIWFRQTSTLIGMPTLVIVMGMGIQKMFFTTTCMSAGWKCEYAFGVNDMAQKYLTSLVTGAGDMEFKPAKN